MDNRRFVRLGDLSNLEGEMTIEEKITGRNIGIIGMARSGMAAALLAKELGGKPFVSDSANAKLLTQQTALLERNGIPYETDYHSERLLACDYIVLSPGVSPEIKISQAAREKGIPLFSELEFASWVCRAKIVAVTGSNGKTTTTTLLGEIFSEAGYHTAVCGNIGKPFSEVVAHLDDKSVAVVEVSTFQLETIADFKPAVALILNLTPDHLDRHGTFERYKALKYRIAENQTEDDFLLLNKDDEEIRRDAIATKAKKDYFTTTDDASALVFVRNDTLHTRKNGTPTPVIDCRDIFIPGPHNLQNAAAAVGAATLFGISPEVMAEVLKRFRGVEHRLEPIGQVAGIHFVNDSKATNIDSVCWALRSIKTPLYLIAGGRDKGNDYQPLVECGKNKIQGIVAIGEAKEKIFNALGQTFPVLFAETMEEAVRKCFELAHPSETVLLSPGCASFDMFENFEHRGRVFKEAVASLKNGTQKNQTVS